MHILVTNDDGPPSNQSSPYIHSLVTTLQSAGHAVSVVLPHVQRSWIGKAHIIGQTLTPSYFRPGALHNDDGLTSHHSFNDGKEEWVLIDGTPASCVQIGLWHLNRDRGAVDLVVSGPNYGRNTTALFSLSSGTVGGAMEASVCGKRAIALSYAFDSRDHDPEIIAAASSVSQRLIERLVQNWPEDVHLYSVNVPLRQNVSEAKIMYTEMLQNRWISGSSFEEVEVDEDTDPAEQEKEIREGEPNGINQDDRKSGARRKQKKFKWAPKFADVHEAVRKAEPGNDGWAVNEGIVSVTPLRANFWHVPNMKGEIKLSSGTSNPDFQSPPPSTPKLYAIIDHSDFYVKPLIANALESQFQDLPLEFITSIRQLPSLDTSLLQFTDYDSLNFEHAANHPKSSLICSYVIRKALIRKHFLSNTISTWLVKHPESPLKRHFKQAIHFELDYAEFLDEALVDAWDLNESMGRNEALGYDTKGTEWWILKPGMSDRGNGIRLFCSMQQLQNIFDGWEEDGDEEEDVEEDADNVQRLVAGRGRGSLSPSGILTSQLRHFVVQPYIDPPLLLHTRKHRKFHVRVYALAVGALSVYVYREMLALFAAETYQTPFNLHNDAEIELACHLTNTCFQDESAQVESIARFWDLEDADLAPEWKNKIFMQICEATGEVFEAAAREQLVHFQALPNAFEVFGVDFLVDAELNVWLLELNACPDFKQTGENLQDVIVGGLFREVVKAAIRPFFTRHEEEQKSQGSSEMLRVRQIDLGRR